jgi:hypothetical protein
MHYDPTREQLLSTQDKPVERYRIAIGFPGPTGMKSIPPP